MRKFQNDENFSSQFSLFCPYAKNLSLFSKHPVLYIYTHIYTYTYTECPASFSNRPQEGRWDRNKHKSPLPFSDINNNRDINVCNCTNESVPIETVRSLEVSPTHFFKYRLRRQRVEKVREEAHHCLTMLRAAGAFLSAFLSAHSH